MSSRRISIRIPDSLGRRLKQRSMLKDAPESEVVREALETYLTKSREKRSAYSLAVETGGIGCLRRAPEDLSSEKHPPEHQAQVQFLLARPIQKRKFQSSREATTHLIIDQFL